MMNICSRSQNNDYHRGALGGLLKDENGVLYGLTNRHVTQAASDGYIYILCGGSKLIKFGITMKRNDGILELTNDIDVFKIHDEYFRCCSSLYMNNQKQRCQAEAITSDCEAVLYGREVFMWRTKFDVDGRRSDERVIGRIASFEVCKHSMFMNGNNILLFTSNNTEEGDSGRALLMQNGDKVYIVGLVIGGMETVNGTNYFLCIKIRHGIELLYTIYGKSFRLPGGELVPHKAKEITALAGISILVKRPETFAKLDFDLVRRIISLMECLGSQEEVNSAEEIVEFENKLSLQVGNRISVNMNETCGSVEEKYVNHCMQACEHLYSEHYERSEAQFKNAIHILIKTMCKHRFLVKILTYITWMLLKTMRYKFLEKLLSKGETYLFEIRADKCLPKYLGYFFFDYARFHKVKGNFSAAMEMAEKSLKYFLVAERESGKTISSKCFTLAMMANLHLLVDINSEHPSALEYEQAAGYISDIEKIGQLPVVAYTTYVMVKSKYYLRRNELEKALKFANCAYKLANEKLLEEELREAHKLIQDIQIRNELCNSKS